MSIYPDIETATTRHNRRIMPKRLSNLERNCNEIFTKGPALTRDILEKVQNVEIGTDTTYIMGYGLKTRQFWVLAGLFLLFLLSSTGTILMWFTNIFDNAVFSCLEIAPNSPSFDMWQRPSPKPLIKLYIFNYTNVDEFQRGIDKKLNVIDLGPYVYEISMERVNLHFNGSRVDYQEQRIYRFMPELSKGRKQNDRLIVPNLPLFAVTAKNQHANFLTRLGVSSLLNTIDARPFLTLPAHRFITGYDDNLYKLSRSVMKLQNHSLVERFGLVSSKAGVSSDVITINTGANDINRVGTIELFNGQSELDVWSTRECNSFNAATDGSIYSPKRIRNKQPVYFYLKEFCRPIPLHYQKQVKILNGKVPAVRYTIPFNIFDNPDRVPSNQCYCDLDLGDCPPQGVFNVSACNFGAPTFLSFPHFYNADPELKTTVNGLNLNPKNFESYIDIHPTLGYVMAGKTRVQLNVQVKKAFGISQVNMFDDDMFLPVAWFELDLEDKTLPEDMVSIIFQTTFTVKSIEIGLKYGCLLTTIVTFLAIILYVKNRWQKWERTNSIRPLQRRQNSVES